MSRTTIMRDKPKGDYCREPDLPDGGLIPMLGSRARPLPVVMGLDGPSAYMRRLGPALRPRTGGWSAPSLTGDIGLSPLWTPTSDSSRARTAVGEQRRGNSWNNNGTMQRKRALVQAPGKPIKNPGVWQRWQINVPSNRNQRQAVLDRDQERQRENYGGVGGRDFASPARSHAASQFFASVPGGGEVTECLPPGAMRRVARPQTRQMNQLPNMATGSAVSSTSAPGGAARDPQSDIPDDLMNEDLVFVGEEGTEVTELLDAYAALTLGIDQASAISGPSGANLGSTGGMKGFNASAVYDPYILRPVFCRFLLASKMCGDGMSVHLYHEAVKLFDKYATTLGSYTALPRTVLIQVIARMLRRKGEEGIEKKAAGIPSYDPVTGELVGEVGPRPVWIKDFFETSLVFAMEHCDFRKRRSEEREREMSGVETGEVPANVLALVSSGSLWPPLPPRSVKEPQLPEWMSGVRQWQEELDEQNPVRLLAMRRYTETVLRGEILGSQLLEPEVLHFAARFRPLFKHMFSAYADWPTPTILLQVAEEDEENAETHKLGHLSFTSFFRFCVDFAVFPTHASFEEIRQIYNDAEAVVEIPEPSPAATPSTLSEPSGVDPLHSGVDPLHSFLGARFIKSSQQDSSVTARGKRPGSAVRPGSTGKPDSAESVPGSPKSAKGKGDHPPSSSGRPANTKPPAVRTSKALNEVDGQHPPGSKESRRLSSKTIPVTPLAGERPGSKQEGAAARLEEREGRSSVSKSQVEDGATVAAASMARRGSCSKPPEDGKAAQHAEGKKMAHLMKSKKALACAAIAESAATAAAEAAVPKAELAFMEKPLSTMCEMELRTVSFFAGIDQWLSDRFVRFADLWSELEEQKDLADACDTGSDSAHGAADIFMSLALLGDGDDHSEVANPHELPPEVLQLQNQILRSPLPAVEPGQRRNSGAERHAIAAAKAAAYAVAAAALAVPPVVVITAAKLLEVIAPMSMANRPTEAELDQMYTFLLQAPEHEQERADSPTSPTGSSSSRKQPWGIAVFQMDKILRTARKYLDLGRQGCCMFLRTDQELPLPEKDVIIFLDALNAALLNRAGFMGRTEDFLEDCGNEFPVTQLLSKAQELGIDFDVEDTEGFRKYPVKEKFCNLLMDQLAPTSTEQNLKRHHVYRALALVQEGRRCQRHVDLKQAMRCLAGDHERRRNTGPTTAFFGLAAFVECLLKLALHRLGGKGSNEIQRGSPAWWKCAWLIALLSGEFSGHLKRHSHEKQIQEYAYSEEDAASPDARNNQVPDSPIKIQSPITRASSSAMVPSAMRRGAADTLGIPKKAPTKDKDTYGNQHWASLRRHTAPIAIMESHLNRLSPLERRAQEVEAWYCRSYDDELPRYVPPCEHLVSNRPDLFDPSTGEAAVPPAASGKDENGWPAKCSQCNEFPSPSGWGTPGCASCSGVEELCLPISKHLFSLLLRTPKPRGLLQPEAWRRKQKTGSEDGEAPKIPWGSEGGDFPENSLPNSAVPSRQGSKRPGI